MSAESSLDLYTQAMNDAENFKDQHTEIFNRHNGLVLRIIDAENALRDDVATEKQGVTNGQYRVTYTENVQTFADVEVLQAMVANDEITEEQYEKIVKTVPRPPRINVSKA